MKGAGDIAVDTLAGLLRPRRAAAIALVVLPLLYAQAVWNIDARAGVQAGALLCGGTLLIAPAAWRILGGRGLWGLLAYGLVGMSAVALLGVVLPRWGGFEDRFLSQPISLPLLLGLFLAGGFGLGRDVEAERSLEQLRARAEALARDSERAELLALRAQLDPHFLFNTLNAIAEWCARDPVVAEQAILALSEVLRTIQAGVRRPSWALSEELSLCRGVLELHRIRDPERFGGQLLGSAPGVEIPPMILLPLIENAFKHGSAAGHPGLVSVRVRPEGEGARVEILNPGPFRGPREGGEGLALVRRRLALSYGDTASLEIGAFEAGTRAVLILPHAPREPA